MNVGLNVPDHTTLSRRNITLKTSLKRIGKPRGRVDLVIDSTGFLIHGEDRWTRHKHGKRKRRGWRKLQIGVSNGFIVTTCLSEYRKPDGEIAPNLIQQVGRIDSITADKVYDQSRVYEAANDTSQRRWANQHSPKNKCCCFSIGKRSTETKESVCEIHL